MNLRELNYFKVVVNVLLVEENDPAEDQLTDKEIKVPPSPREETSNEEAVKEAENVQPWVFL